MQLAERTQEVKRLARLQQAIVNHAGQAILSTDRDGVIQTANSVSEQLFGYSREELIGRVTRFERLAMDKSIQLRLYETLSQAGPTVGHFVNRIVEQGHSYIESLAVNKQGQLVPILIAVSVLLDEQGTLLGYVAIATNLIQIKAMQTMLQDRNREFITFFDGALDMHCIADPQGNISAANQAFQAVLGYSADALKAIPFLYLIHPAEQSFVYHHCLKTIQQQPVRHQVNQFRRKDGSYRIIEWNAIAINQIVYGSARDITERHQSLNQLQHLNQRLQLAT